MIYFGGKTFLERIDERSLQLLLEWRNDFRIWKWCRQNDLLNPKYHEKWLDKISSDPSIEMYTILIQDSDDHTWTNIIGVCGLTSINRINQTAEFSLYIDPDEQRKGYGFDALKVLLNHGFQNLNLNRIWGETFEGNPGIKIFEDLGMVKEGTLRDSYFRSGNFIDSHIYAILRNEFEYFTEQKDGLDDKA